MISCGHCHEKHETVADVKKCSLGDNPTPEAPRLKLSIANPLTTKPDGGRGQYELLQILLAERGMTLLPPYPQAAQRISRDEAKEMINDLIKNHTVKLPDVPEGHYAIPSLTGNNDYDFFKFYEYNGNMHLKRVVGGHPDMKVYRNQVVGILKAILEYGPEKAGKLYAQETNNCWKCNSHLTKYASRQLSIGPDCAEVLGQLDEWMRLQSEWEAAQRRSDVPHRKTDQGEQRQVPKARRSPGSCRPARATRVAGRGVG